MLYPNYLMGSWFLHNIIKLGKMNIKIKITQLANKQKVQTKIENKINIRIYHVLGRNRTNMTCDKLEQLAT